MAIVETRDIRGDVYFWRSMMGACFIASVPIALVYNFFVDRFVEGFTVGAIRWAGAETWLPLTICGG